MLHRLDEDDVYHSKWLPCINEILLECGYNHCRNNQTMERNVILSRQVKQFIHEKFIENWKAQIFNSPKCINYRIVRLNLVLRNISLFPHLK